MDSSINYPDILKQTVQEATRDQPSLQQIKLYPVCDFDSGHFLVVATGLDKQGWNDFILFHARVVERQVIIEIDNFEDGLTSALIDAGIRAEDIITGFNYHRREIDSKL
ncbi:MAG: element excision factor XisI family protein [Cyanobacteriota bacterium]|nr:element excision factor XisI family protein [Cyanobacteriota bacterium]